MQNKPFWKFFWADIDQDDNSFASSSEMKITSIYVPRPSLKIEKSKIEPSGWKVYRQDKIIKCQIQYSNYFAVVTHLAVLSFIRLRVS